MRLTPIILSAALASASVIPVEVRNDEGKLVERSAAGDKCLTLECAKKEYVPIWRGKLCEGKAKCEEKPVAPKKEHTDGYEEYYWVEHIDRKHRHKDNGYRDYYHEDNHDYNKTKHRHPGKVKKVIAKRADLSGEFAVEAADEEDLVKRTTPGESAVGRPYFKPYYEDDPDYESYFEPKPEHPYHHPHWHHHGPEHWHRRGCHPHRHHRPHRGCHLHRPHDWHPEPVVEAAAAVPGKKHDDRDDVQWFREEIVHEDEQDRHEGRNRDSCHRCRKHRKHRKHRKEPVVVNGSKSSGSTSTSDRKVNNKSGNIIKSGGNKKVVEVTPTYDEEED